MVEQKIQVPKYWRRIPQYYRLEATMCIKCGRVYYPPKRVCKCGSREFKLINLSSNGKLVNYTILHQVPIDYEKQRPVIIGLIDLNGVKILAQLTDILEPEKLRIGLEVEKTVRIIKHDGIHGVITYGYKFRTKIVE
ncbi:MAG: cobalt transporter ApaG [Thermoprotei archaeon ex4572_64]|nr:MAG: cobalt transporter ApaG [Thermoprotei archaeon ex4572_64]